MTKKLFNLLLRLYIALSISVIGYYFINAEYWPREKEYNYEAFYYSILFFLVIGITSFSIMNYFRKK